MKTYTLEEICVHLLISQETIVTFIEREWITPLDPDAVQFDDEDLGRLRLILELKKNFNVNEEGVDIILHLVDQLHSLQRIARLNSDLDTK